MTIWKAVLSAVQTGPDLLSQEWCLYPVSFLCDRINYISLMEGFYGSAHLYHHLPPRIPCGIRRRRSRRRRTDFPPCLYHRGDPVHNSIATNKLSSCMGTLLTTGKFAKDGLIPWKSALAGVIFAFAGSSLGAHIALILDARIFMTAMLFILPVTAFYVTRKKSMAEKEPFPFQKTVLLSCTMAFVIGIYDGFYGPGTGTFLILLLMGVAHIRLKEANGITKVINSTTNLAALFVFLANDVVLLPPWSCGRAVQYGRQLFRRPLL